MSATGYTITALVLAVTVAIGFAMKEGNAPLEPKKHHATIDYVCDGDSVTFVGGRKCGVRLWGVDAPERDQKGAEEAKIALQALCNKQPVTYIHVDNDERYNRIVVRLFLKDKREVNEVMIKSGVVKEHMRYSKGFYSQL